MVGGRIVGGVEPVFGAEGVLDMGKASRQRQLNRQRERQRQRAVRGASARPGFKRPGYQPESRRIPSQKEIAVSLIAEAVGAVRCGNQDAYDACLWQLAIEQTPAWTQAVSQGLVGFLRASVTAAWRLGWQPVELARHVGRELSAEHGRVIADMITDEMRGYAAATVDARWAAQVEAVKPVNGVWWGNDAEYLDATGELAGDIGLRGAIATAIETAHLLQHLVVLEPLLPLPGTARPAAKSAAKSAAQEHAKPADERLLSRIRALLAKAESTEFTEEAEALSARAQELMAKYSIDRALLAAETGSKEEPGGRRIAVDNPYEAPKASLLQTVARANRCRVVWSKELGLVTVIGFPADLDAVELLFTSLLVQANSAMLRAGTKRDGLGRSRTRAFRQSFLVSYTVRIGERLSEAADHAEQQATAEQAAASAGGDGDGGGGGKDLVPFLAARHQAVDDAVDAMFGDTLTHSRAIRVTDAEGWQSGRAAADMASLHNHPSVAGAASV
jgi:hypothetical protein